MVTGGKPTAGNNSLDLFTKCFLKSRKTLTHQRLCFFLSNTINFQVKYQGMVVNKEFVSS